MKKLLSCPYRVAHVIYDGPGGSGNVVFSLLENIKSDKFSQEAILFGSLLKNSPFYQKYSDKVACNLIKKHRGFDFRYLLSLIKLIRKKKYDLIFLHDSTASIYGKITKLFSPKVKLVSVYHGAGTRNRLARIFDMITGAVLTNSVICVSEFVRRGLPKALRRKSRVIYSGIRCKGLVYAGRTEETHVPVITTTCRLDPPKDLFTLVRACKKLHDTGLIFKCKIVGDGKQFSDIKKYIDDNHLIDRIELLGWQEKIKDILHESDIFVLSTFSEGLPISILEAMASGLPIVASNVGGIPELVCHEVNGYLFRPGNEEDLFNCLCPLLTNLELRRALGDNSLELIKKFSFNGFIDSWMNFILKMLG